MRTVGRSLVLAVIAFLAAAPGEVRGEMSTKMEPTFTILFDNVPYADGYRTSWGYSCLIRGLEKTVLFDTGADGRILLDNLALVGVDPRTIDAVVLSHFHWDHTGGLHALLPRCEDVTVYLPASFPEAFKDETRTLATRVVEVSGTVSITPGIRTTGVLSQEIPEQALVLEVPEGLVVVTGCAHPGLRAICRRSLSVASEKPIFLMGGFHLREFSKAQVTDLVRDLEALGVRAMAPSHCTGGTARHTIEKLLEDRCLESGAGRVLSMDDIRSHLQ